MKFKLWSSFLVLLCGSFLSAFYFFGPVEKPILFVSRQIPCCGSVYMQAANALPGVGNFSKYQLAAPSYLCILNPDKSIDTLINGSHPTDASLHLIDISSPVLSYDAKKIVFAGLKNGNYKTGSQKTHNAWRIYVIQVDGSGLRQVSFDEGPVDLSQFHPGARGVLSGVDDTHPIWLPDGRICFSSTRYRDIAMYNVARTSNLFVVNADGTGLHRITTEKNGADRPSVDPLTGKIVYSRWWRNFYWPYDSMHSVSHPVYTNGWLYHNGLTSNLDQVIENQTYMFNNNAFSLTEINPDGSGLKLFSAHFREISSNSIYGGCFEADGNYIGNWFPIEHQTESSGFGGIKRYFRGSARRPQALAGITGYGNFDYYISSPPSYGIFKGTYAAEPSVMSDKRILHSRAADPNQDYGIYVMNNDGSGPTLIYDHPGTTELHAQVIEPKPLPPILLDKIIDQPSELSPKGMADLRRDGTFEFDCRNIFYNGPLDDGIIAAPGVGDVGSVRFFASPLLADQYGSLEMLNFPLLYNEIEVDAFGRVIERDAPANLALFEQARSPKKFGYRVSRTGGGIMDGAGHVTGFNFGKPEQKVSCVGCHAGHSMIEVPQDPERLFFHNLAPGAIAKASRSMNDPGYLIDKKNRKTGSYWFTPEGVPVRGQWVSLQWKVPVFGKEIVLHNIPDTNRALVKHCKLRVYRDSAFTELVEEFEITTGLSADGTILKLSKVQTVQSLSLEFIEVKGGIYHWNAATLGEIELIGSIVDPKRFSEITDCMGIAYGQHRLDSCGQCLLPDDPKFNDCLSSADVFKIDDRRCRIFPNPFLKQLQINIPEGDQIQHIRCIHMSGQEINVGPVYHEQNICRMQIPASTPGIYWLEIQCKDRVERHCLVRL